MKLTRRQLVRHGVLAAVALFCIVSVNYRTFFLPWFAMTEEFPYAQEVLRLLSGDFHQRFFDIPGTPFIGAVTLVFGSILAVISVITGGRTPFADLGFEHLQLLYFVMRVLSLAAFVAATWVVWSILRRFASPWAAVFGAIVFVAHPILALTLYHTRIEPTGVLLVSAAILAWLRAIETGRHGPYLAAGLFGGLAMAARFPLALATLPALVLYAVARPERFAPAVARIDRLLAGAVLAVVLFGGAVAALLRGGLIARSALTDRFFLSVHHGGYPRATRQIAMLWIALGVTVVAVVILAAIPRTRGIVARYRDSSLQTLVAFFPVGVVIGVPTLFGGADYFLASVEMFLQRNAYVQPNIGRGVWNVASYYLFGAGGFVALFDPAMFVEPRRVFAQEAGVLFTLPLLLLFVCGLIAWPANRWLYGSIVFGCVIGVASQFGKLHTVRHLAGWLPWFCIVIAVGADWLVRRTRATPPVLVPLFALCVVAIVWQRELSAGPVVGHLVEKNTLQTPLGQWLRANIAPHHRVFHTCCEPITSSVVLSWMKANGVAVPESAFETDSVIWFGQRSALEAAGEGYVVTSRLTYPGQYVNYYRQMNPAEIVDPYNDGRFHRRYTATGQGHNSYDVFHFVMQGAPRPTSGGISVLEATYGQSCAGAQVPSGWTNTVRRGNVTRAVARSCNRRDACELTISSHVLGDPAPFCAKDFTVEWTCPDGRTRRQAIPAEANGTSISLTCATSDGAR